MMNTLARQCDVEHLILNVDIQNRQHLFDTVGKYLHLHHGWSAAEIANRLGEREKLGSTGLGQGVAIPHARLAGLQAPVAILVRPALPIPFDAPDSKPVGLFFILLVPERASQQHLQRLADAARLLNERGVRESLHTCATAHEMRRVLLDWSQS